MEHDLRCWPEHYAAIERGVKSCELRLNDRPYQAGDALLLREWEPLENRYTGRELRVRVTHVLSGGVWLAPGYVAMSIRRMAEDNDVRPQADWHAVAIRRRAEIDALFQQLAVAVEDAGIARMERDAARADVGREWQNVLTWLIEDTQERLVGVADPNVTFYQGKLSALAYLLTLAQEDIHGMTRAALRREGCDD